MNNYCMKHNWVINMGENIGSDDDVPEEMDGWEWL